MVNFNPQSDFRRNLASLFFLIFFSGTTCKDETFCGHTTKIGLFLEHNSLNWATNVKFCGQPKHAIDFEIRNVCSKSVLYFVHKAFCADRLYEKKAIRKISWSRYIFLHNLPGTKFLQYHQTYPAD